ncbi:S1 family peptidase [Actinoalloteichus hymeniacidonis]|uniref:Trypsin n=1 Tax=Actinoalloteichus hymeniacidonis TaxID=340345 RepID=A0AAC9HL34_9PSEU|nr:serine protease [Actinoalloteichus hymeniacidonis]AOS61164.1 Trypsin [Actinoalloteichus hymeniacidonis]MBB5910835.1 secreted trypsin-like serine protease [Actinoalloteichus hymeniacidonis]
MRMPRTLGAVLAAVVMFTAALAGAGSAVAGPQSAPRIVGGTQSVEKYSFMASIQRKSEGRDHWCGGALVDPIWVVTTAHCLQGDLDAYTVRVGSNDRTAGGEYRRVVEMIAHPNWDGLHGDIAMLRLERAVTAAPVAIAKSSPIYGDPIRLLGWGKTCNTYECSWEYPKLLREIDRDVAFDNECSRATIDGRTELCVDVTSKATSCYGDSGGPAVERMLAGGWGLVGLDGRGGDSVCGERGLIYTDVTAYQDWIRSTVA